MFESEVQSLVACILCSGEILEFLLLIHRIPLGISGLVPLDIVELDQQVQEDIHNTNSQQLLVAAVVIWCVIYSNVSN